MKVQKLKSSKPTLREAELLSFLVKFINEFSFPPSIREMGAELNLSSTNYTRHLLSRLEKKKYVKKTENKARATVPTEEGKLLGSSWRKKS